MVSAEDLIIKEWRADPNVAAGGQFIEQGSHAIDSLDGSLRFKRYLALPRLF